MSNTPSSEKEAILTFEDKKYDIKSLPKEVQELIKGMQVADAQLRMHDDSLKVLAVESASNCTTKIKTRSNKSNKLIN